MNILVTGANGQLGRELRIVAEQSDNRYVFADIVPASGLDTLILDVTDEAAVCAAVREYNIDVIVNCAAYTDVNKAEFDKERCGILNAGVPGILASAAKLVEGLLIHISTDYVFDGRSARPYREDDAVCPESVYGHTKSDGETAVKDSGCRYVIIRTSWLYSEFGKNFVRTILALTSEKQQIKVVADQTGTPTYALDLATLIFDIIENDKAEGNEGVYHYSNEGACTWYEFAKTIAVYSGHDGCEILPCSTEEFPSPARRPLFSVLDKSKVRYVFGVGIPQWTDSLRKCLNNIAE